MNEEYKNTEQMETLEGMIPAEEEESREEVVREVLPCIPLRGVSIFPHTVVHFDIGREKSIRALENAMASDKLMFVATQKDENILIPKVEDMYEIGTVVRVKQMLKIQGDAVRVLVEGICRGSIDQVITEETYISATINRLEEDIREEELSLEDKAAMRIIREEFVEYAALTSQITDEVVDKTLAVTEPGPMIDKIANELFVSCARKQNILGELNFSERLKALTELIGEENEIAVIEKELSQKVKENIDNGQREYFLREKLKAIQTELGVEEDAGAESAEWLEKLDELKLDEKVDEKVRKEISKFSKMMPSSAESSVIRNYVETILDLPWNKSSRVNSNLKKAEKILEEDHYGMKKVKERILEFLAVHMLNPEIKGQIICLAGPPGIGKTSIAKSVAKAMGRNYARVSLGGVRDEADIRGHRKTYVGAMPGRVITAISQAGSMNPLILFDEIDKLCSDIKGDPSSAMLEVLDSEQNNAFRDHFIEVPFDLSKAVFITTANDVSAIPGPLRDRMEIIELPSYTAVEKFHIAKEHLVPKQLKEHGLKARQLKITDDAINDIIQFYTKEAGVRTLERKIASICRKTARMIASEEVKRVTVKRDDLHEFLGVKKYLEDISSKKDQVGVVNGLAWTSVGGVLMPLEVLVMKGTGKIEVTGSLGDVMKESAKIAVSYVRSVADKYGIDQEFYKNNDIHIHAPEGAVPKDGPSAGVTMTTALVSALSGSPVRSDVAMTGEITLHGNVLPIGGLREKTMAAYKAEIKKVVIPKANVPDLEEVDEAVKSAIEFIPCDNLKNVLDTALIQS